MFFVATGYDRGGDDRIGSGFVSLYTERGLAIGVDEDISLEKVDDFLVVALKEEVNADDFVVVEVSLIEELKLDGFVAGFDNVKLEDISLLAPLLAR